MGTRFDLLFMIQSYVYKSFLFVEYTLSGRAETVLIDGATGVVAGRPGWSELERLKTSDALSSMPIEGDEITMKVIASECPICGHENDLDRRARLQLCSVCHRALEVTADGIRDRSYSFAPLSPLPRGASHLVYVPFWRFDFHLRAEDGTQYDSLEEYLRDIESIIREPVENERIPVRLDHAVAAGYAHLKVLKAILALPTVSGDTRAKILNNPAWPVPQILAKKE